MSNQAPNGIISAITCKCPRCRTGRLFEVKNPYHFGKVLEMPRYCEECGKDLAPEPSFYDGSMYVNYGFSVAMVVSTFTAFNVLFDDPNVYYMIAVAIGLTAVLGPVFLRLSRSIWAHMFFRFDPDAKTKFKTGQYEA